ncbi:MAG TPA: mandelate racemase/muconate lactonizing enzyme family protein [Bryobacteraceae bacterium]|jgi:L-alanine-DL-glutamate epimerase-like enolase superfamily enzyme|nr:mandelate racemase/muconate lactonizing enzyme family protein [Bryobacteraceae bacterium]
MDTWTRRGLIGSLSGVAAEMSLAAQQRDGTLLSEKRKAPVSIKITDLRCAIIGRNPVVRIVTDQGVSGYGQAESAKPYLKPMVLFYKDYILGEDPTDVERVMLKIRRLGAFKPWGSAVSAIEIALWDIAGQVAGIPVYKLLGGKIRDRVRAYNGGVRFPMTGQTPQDYAENMAKMKEAKEGFTLIKQAVGFHNPAMMRAMPNGWYDEPRTGAPHSDRGLLTERGLDHIIACVEAMKKVLGDETGLALDCGPGWTVKDAITFARALEPLHITWLEDLITGDYTPYPNADVFREVTQSTSVAIHTGEEIYLRQNFKDLIEKQAVNVIGPDPEDVGGLAETKWIAEYADLHGILIAPHGIFDGLIGLAAHVQLAAALPQNYIAFEYPVGQPEWWYQIVDGLPDPIMKAGFIDVWDRPGLGVTFNIPAAKSRLIDEDRHFFD